jgi:DHA2 family lincomycin resistance protein-like MFS transporter
MNITLEVAPKEKLGTYMGIMGAMTTLGPSLSVIVAGGLLSFFNWHVLLWVFAGLSFLCFLLGAFLLGNISKLTNPKLDTSSVVLIGIALVGILYAISTIFSGNSVIALIAAVVGVICLIGFIKRQKKLAEPLIDLRPLSVKPFAVGVLLNMISLIVIFAMNIVMPIFMQSALEASSFRASLTLFPAILLSCVISPIAGRLYDRHGARIILPLGFALIGIFTFALSICTGEKSFLLMAVLYIPVICGSALIIGPVQSFTLSNLEPQLNPFGITVMSTGFQIAGCIGASLFTGVYSTTTSAGMAKGSSLFEASSSGFMAAGMLAAAFALIGFLLAMHLRRYMTLKCHISNDTMKS